MYITALIGEKPLHVLDFKTSCHLPLKVIQGHFEIHTS